MDEGTLTRLLEVGRGLLSELDHDAVLRRVLDVARELSGARYAAVAGSSAQQGEAKVREQITGALSGDFARDVDVHPAEVGGAAGYEAVVVAEVPVLGLGGPAVRVEVSGHAVAEVQP